MDIAGILRQLAISAPAILLAITLHEVAHGYVAYKLGDPTAKQMGRLTLNPIAHIDPFGTILMPILLLIFTQGQFVFGYAKPVPINPYNFKNIRKDMALSAAGGPGANLILAFLSIIVLKFILTPLSMVVPSEFYESFLRPLNMMLLSSVVINSVLCAFNLIPIPPLDGGRILAGLLPHRHAITLNKIEPYGMIIVMIMIATGMTRVFIGPLLALIQAVLGIF